MGRSQPGNGATWTIPAERMKMAKGHRVPLSSAAVSVLRQARQYGDGEGLCVPVEPGRADGGEFVDSVDRHGRASGQHDRSRDAVELSEIFARTPTKSAILPRRPWRIRVAGVEGSYLRSDVLDRRRALMQDWGVYCAR